MSRNIFTKDELDIAIQMFNSGKSYREIGRKLNRSHSTIMRHLKKHGCIRKNNRKTMDKETLMLSIKLFDEGKNYNEISKVVGLHSKTVSRHLRHHGRLFSKDLSINQIQDVEEKRQNITKHVCQFCNKEFSSTGGGSFDKFCSTECWQNFELYTRRDSCKQCGKLLSPFEKDFCSKNCESNFNYKFCKVCSVEINQGNKCKRCLDKEYKNNLRQLRFENARNGFNAEVKTCLYCNNKYLYHYFNRRQKFCSEKCRSKYYREQRRHLKRLLKKEGNYQEGITLNRVYRKYNGICNYCGIKCDYEDMEVIDGHYIAGANYPSIDHIHPLSKGGSHTWDNVQLLCLECNSSKSDKVEAS